MIRFRVVIDPILAFILLSRPLFLAGGFLFHGLGVVVALYLGARLSWPILIWTQLVITATQAMTHFGNEYFDQAADRLNNSPTPWSGGSRVLPAGDLPGWIALAAAGVCAAIALLAGAVLLSLRPDVAGIGVGIILAALTLSWFYSAPPLRLHSRGLGEVTVAAVTQGLTPLLGFLMQTTPAIAATGWPLLLGTVLPIACIQIPMMLGVTWPDVAADAAAGKRTLAVRLGPVRSARLHNFMLILAYGMLPVGLLLGVPRPVIAFMALPAPIALWQMRQVVRRAHTDPQRWAGLAFGNMVLLNLTAGLAGMVYWWIG